VNLQLQSYEPPPITALGHRLGVPLPVFEVMSDLVKPVVPQPTTQQKRAMTLPSPNLTLLPLWHSTEQQTHGSSDVSKLPPPMRVSSMRHHTPKPSHTHPLVGAEIVKNFESDIDHLMHPFHGTVVSFHHPYYKVVYTDGDEEEMSATTVREHLATIPKHQPPRVRNQPSRQPCADKAVVEQRSAPMTPHLTGYATTSPLGRFLTHSGGHSPRVGDAEDSCQFLITPPSSWVRPLSRQRKPVSHPQGLDMSFCPSVIASDASSLEKFQSSFHNARAFVFRSVQESTKGSYSTGWRHWLAYTQATNTDQTLQTTPHWWRPSECAYPFKVGFVMAFLAYMAVDKHLAPSTCSTYMS